MNWFLYIVSVLTVLTVALQKEALALQLLKIVVPSFVVIDHDDVDPIPLNCQFKDDKDSQSLVVKWMKDNRIIFQYIKGHGTSVIPEFKEEVQSLSSEPDNEHSGILLLNPSIDTSGIYRCHVQTDKESLSMERRLHIIDVQNYTHTFKYNRIQNETQLVCNIENVFPVPEILIQTIDGERIDIVSINSTELSDGKYSTSAIAVQRTDDESDNKYQCIMMFNDLSYNLTFVTSGCISFRRLPIWSHHILLTILLALVTYKTN
ncbi:uncharacterized protein [Eurosta solidaginis]|uniref:uncharacterized protein n=1 Tax=Eurosta solidaginis TaxID=178769 RepID=UPI00353162E3